MSLSILSAKPPAMPTIWNGLDFLIRRAISFQEVVILAFVCTSRTSIDDTTEVRYEMTKEVKREAAMLTWFEKVSRKKTII